MEKIYCTCLSFLYVIEGYYFSPHKQNSAVSEESKQDLQKQVADEIELKQSQMEKFHQPAIAMGLVNGPSAVNLNVAD